MPNPARRLFPETRYLSAGVVHTDSAEIAFIEKGKKPLRHKSFADPAEFVPAYYVQLKHRNTPVEVSKENYAWLTRKLYQEVIEEEQHA